MGIALSALLASGCVTGGNSDNDEIVLSGGNGSAATIYGTGSGGLAGDGAAIDSGGPRSPGPGSGVPQPFGPGVTTGGGTTTGGTTGATGGSSGTTGTGTTGTGGTSGGGTASTVSGVIYIPNGGGGNPFLVGLASATSNGALTLRSTSPISLPGEARSLAIRLDNTLFIPNATVNNVRIGQVLNDGPTSVPLGTPEPTGTTPSVVVLTPDFQFLYVANSGSRDISQFAMGASGVITPLLPRDVPSQTPSSALAGIAVEPNGNHLYALESSVDTIDIFQIGTGGALTAANVQVSAGPSPAQLVFFPKVATPVLNDDFAYVTNAGSNTVRAYQRPGNGGDLIALTPAFDFPTGGNGPEDALIHPSLPVLYVLNVSSSSLAAMAIDTTTGVPVLQGAPLPLTPSPRGFVVTPDGRWLYVWNSANTIEIFSLSTAGIPTPAGTFTGAGLNQPGKGVVARDRGNPAP